VRSAAPDAIARTDDPDYRTLLGQLVLRGRQP